MSGRIDIFYDGVVFRQQKAGGVNRYFKELVCRLPSTFAPWVYGAAGSTFATSPNVRRMRASPCILQSGFIGGRIESLWLSLQVRRARPDVFHPTYYNSPSLDPEVRGGRPLVITVYDMIAERYPEEMDPSGKEAGQKRFAITEAAAVICISEATKRDLLDWHPGISGKVSVVHLAADLPPPVAFQGNLPSRYFLFVGGRIKYKNFRLVAEAIAAWPDADGKPHLCVIGAPFFGFEVKMLEGLGIQPWVHHLGYVDDATLADLYRKSVALVYPSRYEGFGIPPLEAMLCETPVIAANTSSLPEIVGDAGILVDPDSVEQLSHAMQSMLDNVDLRQELIRRGKERVGLFNWDRTAADTATVYRSVVDHGSAQFR